MLKCIKSLLALLIFAFIPFVVNAANDVSFSDSAVSIYLPTQNLSYVVSSGGTISSVTAGTNTISVTVEASASFTITSTGRSSFEEISKPATCTSTATCTETQSTLTITCGGGVQGSHTFTVTPGGLNTCSANGGNTGSPGGSNSGSSGTSPTTPTPSTSGSTKSISSSGTDITLTVDTKQKISVGGELHSIKVTAADNNAITMIVQSTPQTVTVTTSTPVEVDLDNDGKNDLKIVYKGLDAVTGKPMVTLTSLTKTTVKPSPITISCALPVKKAYKAAGSSAVYYVTPDCTKRPFPYAPVYFTYFNSWSDTNIVDAKLLSGIASDSLGFMPWGPKYDPQYGALVKVVSDPKVYLLLGTERYWIEDETVAIALYGSKWASWVEDVGVDLLSQYTEGTVIDYTSHHPNFTLIKYKNSPKVYRLEPDSKDSTKQVKRHIVNEAAFKALKFRFDRIVTVQDTEIYTDGESLTASNSDTLAPMPAPTPTSKYIFTSDLLIGSESDEVKQLQIKLQSLGYFPSNIDVSGYYGQATSAAVKAFQAAKGIEQTGSVGPKTRTALNAA